MTDTHRHWGNPGALRPPALPTALRARGLRLVWRVGLFGPVAALLALAVVGGLLVGGLLR